MKQRWSCQQRIKKVADEIVGVAGIQLRPELSLGGSQ